MQIHKDPFTVHFFAVNKFLRQSVALVAPAGSAWLSETFERLGFSCGDVVVWSLKWLTKFFSCDLSLSASKTSSCVRFNRTSVCCVIEYTVQVCCRNSLAVSTTMSKYFFTVPYTEIYSASKKFFPFRLIPVWENHYAAGYNYARTYASTESPMKVAHTFLPKASGDVARTAAEVRLNTKIGRRRHVSCL